MQYKMNAIFDTISWTHYSQLLGLVLLIYYILISLSCFPAEVNYLFRYGSFRPRPQADIDPFLSLDECILAVDKKEAAIAPETEILLSALRIQIDEWKQQPCAPADVPRKLIAIIRQFPKPEDLTQRAAITQMLVAECEKTGIALLNEDEVDQWWSD